jgi:hypothetical protein
MKPGFLQAIPRKKIWQDQTIGSAKDACLKGLSTRLKNPSGKGNRLIVVHIGSEKGFMDSGSVGVESHSAREYHEEITGEAFHEWFQKILSNIDSVLIGSASYHTVNTKKVTYSISEQKKHLNWLKQKKIPMEKEQLLMREMLSLFQNTVP